VSALKEAEKREAAKGDDRIRYELSDMLSEMAGKVADLSGAELADLYRRVHRAYAPKPVSVGTARNSGEQAAELAQAA
jgi:L-fucose mutarotase/ribose pyranase (RbsD/FucU family)